MRVNFKDVKIEFYKSSGPGGQHKNKRFMAVRATHLPSGIAAVSQEYRSQATNKEVALQRLRDKLALKFKKQKPRIATKIPRAIKANILHWKKKRSAKKKLRRKSFEHEEG
jgi:protein subunit release factor A